MAEKMMVTLYYADISSHTEEEILNQYADRVDQERLSKLLRTGAKKDQVRSLIAGWLLQMGVREATGKTDHQVIPFTYRYSENGKPYLADYPSLFFSLSHSGNYAACAIAEKEIGLDIQEHRKIKEGLENRFFTQEEIRRLNEIKRPEAAPTDSQAYRAAFFQIWSGKESYLKYTGLGMKQALNGFFIDTVTGRVREKAVEEEKETGREVACLSFFSGIPGYSCCLCMQKEIRKIRVKEIVLVS